MFFLKIYTVLTKILRPVFRIVLQKRVESGKEDSVRYLEKRGIPSKLRPTGKLVWIHAVSVGESVSALSLIPHLQQKGYNVLITTATLSSAKVLEQRLPKDVIHQYAPLDIPLWVNDFVNHWHPDFVLWLESELWPNTFITLKTHDIPLFLINARMSKKTLKRLGYMRPVARAVFSLFTGIYAQRSFYAKRIKQLSGCITKSLGNLKYSAPLAPVSEKAYTTIITEIGDRPVWVALSTHPEDEIFIEEAVRNLHKDFPNLLTIILPRHPERQQYILDRFSDLTVVSRSERDPITNATNIYIADTIGETGVFLSASPICFIGGSTSGQYGGHNPIEPAGFGCAILQGTDTNHFEDVTALLNSKKAHIQTETPSDLYEAISMLLNEPEQLQAYQNNAQDVVKSQQEISNILLQDIFSVLEKRKK